MKSYRKRHKHSISNILNLFFVLYHTFWKFVRLVNSAWDFFFLFFFFFWGGGGGLIFGPGIFWGAFFLEALGIFLVLIFAPIRSSPPLENFLEGLLSLIGVSCYILILQFM